MTRPYSINRSATNSYVYVNIYIHKWWSQCGSQCLLCRPRATKPWWRHQMETFSALLAICEGNSPVPTQRPVTRNFDVFFDLRLNKRLNKQWQGWWFETPSHPLWRHCRVMFLFSILVSTTRNFSPWSLVERFCTTPSALVASTAWGPIYLRGLTVIPAWISNHMPSKVWDEIGHPFQNLNGCKFWMDKQFHPILYNGCNYLSMLGLKLIYIDSLSHWWLT